MKDMKKKFLVIVIAIAVLVGVTFAVGAAQQGSGSQGEQDWQQTFDELDRDDKGYITRAEVEHMPDLLEQWSELDVNQDDRLDELEFYLFEPAETGDQTAGTSDQTEEAAEQAQ